MSIYGKGIVPFVFAATVYKTNFELLVLLLLIIVLDTWQWNFMASLYSIAYTTRVLVLSRELALLLRNVVANGLIVRIVPWLLLDRLLDVVNMALDTHMLVISFTLTWPIAMIGIFRI